MLPAIATATGVMVAATYYIINLRNSSRVMETTLETRQAQLFMPIYSKMNDGDFMRDGMEILYEWKWTDYEDFERKYLDDRDNRAKFWSMSNYFEGIGVLVKTRLIGPGFIDDLISSGVIGMWEKLRPVVVVWRVRNHIPQLNEHFEYLYSVVKGIAERQQPELRAVSQ